MEVVTRNNKQYEVMTVYEFAVSGLKKPVTPQAITCRIREARLPEGVTARKIGNTYLLERLLK